MDVSHWRGNSVPVGASVNRADHAKPAREGGRTVSGGNADEWERTALRCSTYPA